MKHFIAAFAFALLLPVLALADALIAAGYDTESVGRVWETNAFFERMQALTGIEVTGHAISDEKEYAAFLESLKGGESQADLLFKANLSREQERELLNAGAILDLEPLIEANMPNLTKLLSEHPDWKRQIALEDSRIATLPFINLHERQVGLWLNAAWLEALGVPFPETLEGLHEALVAIAERDPNGNGKKDERAAGFIGVYEMRWLLPLFGIVADDYNVCRTQNGELAFAPEQEGYRDFVRTLRDWYSEGLIHKDAFTDTHTAKALIASSENTDNKENTSGMLVSITPYTNVEAKEITKYRVVLLPGPDGKTCWRDFLGELWTGTFALTSGCKNPEAALAWVDALYAEEGALLAYIGLEGEDYTWNAEGYWAYHATEQSEMEDIRANRIIYTGTSVPGLYPDKIELVDSEEDRWVFAESEKVRKVSERVLPTYFIPADMAEEVGKLSLTLGEMVDVGIARFITGEIPLDDAHWASWLSELNAAGSGRLVELLGTL